MSNKLYQEELVYIPSDLVGNAVIDGIRKRLDLQTVPDAEQKLQQLLFSNTDKIKVKIKLFSHTSLCFWRKKSLSANKKINLSDQLNM